MSKYYKYLIFDMDGTLVDSMKYWRSLAGEYLRSKSVKIDLEVLEKELRNLSISEAAKLFNDKYGITGDLDSMGAEMNVLMERHYKENVGLKGNVLDYIIKRKEEGCHLCVASATHRYLMELCLKKLDILQYFDFFVSCEELQVNKSQPDIYDYCTKQWSTSSDMVAVYEDAYYALSTAKKAGYYTVAVYDEVYKNDWNELSTLANEAIYKW